MKLYRLEKLRDEKYLLKKDMAKNIGVAQSVYSEWENGKFLILSPFLIEICQTYGYSIDWILGRSEDKFLK